MHFTVQHSICTKSNLQGDSKGGTYSIPRKFHGTGRKPINTIGIRRKRPKLGSNWGTGMPVMGRKRPKLGSNWGRGITVVGRKRPNLGINWGRGITVVGRKRPKLGIKWGAGIPAMRRKRPKLGSQWPTGMPVMGKWPRRGRYNPLDPRKRRVNVYLPNVQPGYLPPRRPRIQRPYYQRWPNARPPGTHSSGD